MPAVAFPESGYRALWAWVTQSGSDDLTAQQRWKFLKKMGVAGFAWMDENGDGLMSGDEFIEAVKLNVDAQDRQLMHSIATALDSLIVHRKLAAVEYFPRLFIFLSDDGVSLPTAAFKKFAEQHLKLKLAKVASNNQLHFPQFIHCLHEFQDTSPISDASLQEIMIRYVGLQVMFLWCDSNLDWQLQDGERQMLMSKLNMNAMLWTDMNSDGQMSFVEFSNMLPNLPVDVYATVKATATFIGALVLKVSSHPVHENTISKVMQFFGVGEGDAAVFTGMPMAGIQKRIDAALHSRGLSLDQLAQRLGCTMDHPNFDPLPTPPSINLYSPPSQSPRGISPVGHGSECGDGYVRFNGPFCTNPHLVANFRPFKETNYLKIYQAWAKYKTASHEERLAWMEPLLSELEWPTDLRDPDEIAVVLWSSDKIYKDLNNAILCDEAKELTKFACFIRALNSFITSHPAEHQAILWRGTKINGCQIVPPDWEKPDGSGVIFRVPMYLAASECLLQAKKFSNKGRSPIMKIKVPRGCLNCTKLPPHLCQYKEEKEWLIPPYSPLKYIGLEPGFDEKMVPTYEVMDGQHVLDLERRGLYVGTHLLIAEPEVEACVDYSTCSIRWYTSPSSSFEPLQEQLEKLAPLLKCTLEKAIHIAWNMFCERQKDPQIRISPQEIQLRFGISEKDATLIASVFMS